MILCYNNMSVHPTLAIYIGINLAQGVMEIPLGCLPSLIPCAKAVRLKGTWGACLLLSGHAGKSNVAASLYSYSSLGYVPQSHPPGYHIECSHAICRGLSPDRGQRPCRPRADKVAATGHGPSHAHKYHVNK